MLVDLSVVIPIYNAKDIVENSVGRISKVLDPLAINYEILLRDDGSIDGSHEMLKKIAQQYGRVACFSNSANEGLGSTLRKLFQEAEGDHIVYCDCDLPFGEEVVPLLLGKAKENDIVIASRYKGIGNYVSLPRKIVSIFYFLLCKILFNIPVRDIGSGSVMIRKETLSRLDLRAKGFGIHAELFVKAKKNGLSIYEIAAKSRQTDIGSFRIFRHGFSILFETISLWLRRL